MRLPRELSYAMNQEGPVLSAATVRVVDDDPGTVMTLAYALRTTGCRVMTAFTGTDAIRQAGHRCRTNGR